MGYWYDGITGTEYEWDNADLTVETTDNPVVMVLLDQHGEPLAEWTARPPVGYR